MSANGEAPRLLLLLLPRLLDLAAACARSTAALRCASEGVPRRPRGGSRCEMASATSKEVCSCVALLLLLLLLRLVLGAGGAEGGAPAALLSPIEKEMSRGAKGALVLALAAAARAGREALRCRRNLCPPEKDKPKRLPRMLG